MLRICKLCLLSMMIVAVLFGHGVWARSEHPGRLAGSSGVPGADHIVLLRGPALSELTWDVQNRRWHEKRLAKFASDGEGRTDFSGPALSPLDDVLVCRSTTVSTRNRIELYTWHRGKAGFYCMAQFLAPEYWGPGVTLDAWVPVENLLTLTTSAPEGWADFRPIRLLSGGKVAFDDAADGAGKRALKALGPDCFFGAVTYSRDGSLFAGGSYRRLVLYDRRSHHLRRMRTPVNVFWSLGFSPDNKAICWVGEVGKGNPEPPAGIDYMPDLNSVGVVWLTTGKTSIYRVNGAKGYQRGGTFLDQWHCRVRINATKTALYFIWNGDLARFDLHSSELDIIARGVDGFAIADE